MWLMAFWGEARSEAAARATESPITMTLPLWILSAPSLFLGFYLFQNHRFAYLLHQAEVPSFNLTLACFTSVVAIFGMAVACEKYARLGDALDPVSPSRVYALLRRL